MSTKIKPREIALDAASLCQLKCHSCPRSTSSFRTTIGYGFLKFDDFRSLIDRNPGIVSIELSNWGEIFLNPDLIEILRYAHTRNIALQAMNGVNLNYVGEDVLEGLVKYKFRYLKISLDGASNETYKIYRIGGNFDNVINNIEKINNFKRFYQSEYPVLSWQFVIFGHNEHELPKARKMAADLGMRFHPKISWDEDFSPIKDHEFVRKETGLAMISRQENKQRFNAWAMPYLCNTLWDRPTINWDGKLLGCLRNFWGDFGDNAFRDRLDKVVNNEKIQYARDMLLGKKKARDNIPCTTCEVYQSMVYSGNFLKRKNAMVRSAYHLLIPDKLRKYINEHFRNY